MARSHPGQHLGGFLDFRLKHFPHRWHRVANCIQSPPANHKATAGVTTNANTTGPTCSLVSPAHVQVRQEHKQSL